MADVERTMLITGDFTESEFAEVCALLRRLDNARPTGRFRITVNDPDATLGDAEEVMRRSLPEQEDRRTTLVTARFPKAH